MQKAQGPGVCIPFPGDLPDPGIEPTSPAEQILYQLSHQGSPKNPGVGSLSLLQEVFQSQELNRSLPCWERLKARGEGDNR